MAQMSLDRLCPEILALIFEELYRVEPVIFRTLKTLSRSLNVIATPFRYRRIWLRPEFFQVSGEAESFGVLPIIRLYTRHLIVEHDLGNSGAVENLLLECTQLQDLTWYLQNDSSPLPAEIAKAALSRNPPLPVHLHVRGRPSSWTQQTDVADSFSSLNLRSLNIQLYAAAGTFRQFNKLLVGSRDTESLTLLTSSVFLLNPRMGRLPPMRELILRAHKWNYSENEVSQVWDFSKLLYLEIGHVNLMKFLSTVPETAFSNLRELRILVTEDNLRGVAGGRESKWSEATDLLERQLRSVRGLEVVEITCDVRKLNLDGISQNHNLRILKLRDFGEYDSSMIATVRKAVVSGEKLELLSRCCPLVTELDLGYHCSNELQNLSILAAVSQFQTLRSLTLRTYAPLTTSGNATTTVDNNLESATNAVKYLQRRAFAIIPITTFFFTMRTTAYNLSLPVPLQQRTFDVVREMQFGQQGDLLRDAISIDGSIAGVGINRKS